VEFFGVWGFLLQLTGVEIWLMYHARPIGGWRGWSIVIRELGSRRWKYCSIVVLRYCSSVTGPAVQYGGERMSV
jgi:hypothetical protein